MYNDGEIKGFIEKLLLIKKNVIIIIHFLVVEGVVILFSKTKIKDLK